MPRIDANGITLEYETAGQTSDAPLLLIMGLGGQLINWDARFVDALADRGFFVVRFDNRDVGLSTWFDESGPADIRAVASDHSRAAYLLADMADDAAVMRLQNQLVRLGVEAALSAAGVEPGAEVVIADQVFTFFPEMRAAAVAERA